MMVTNLCATIPVLGDRVSKVPLSQYWVIVTVITVPLYQYWVIVSVNCNCSILGDRYSNHCATVPVLDDGGSNHCATVPVLL